LRVLDRNDARTGLAAQSRRSLRRALCATIGALTLGACSDRPPRGAANDPAQLLIVDCLMSGQVRKLGAFATGISPRYATKTALYECELDGGEYALPNTDPEAALNIWLPFAIKGDAEAQTQTGELYEKGIGSVPDYETAAKWYRLAAEQGFARAMIDLGSLYERGVGVQRDPARAAVLFRQASGFQQGASAPSIHIIDPIVLMADAGTRGPPATVSLRGNPRTREITGQAVADAGLATIMLNGAAVKPDADGLFHVALELTTPATDVRIIATDRKGQRAVAHFTLINADGENTTADQRPPSRNQRATGEYYALLIGNQNYRRYEALNTPLRDVRDMKVVLERRFGFKVMVLTDATRGDIFAALNRLRGELSARDNLLVFYAGHGEIDPLTQRGYWVPVDGEPRNPARWVSIVDITDQLNAIAAKQVLVVADSCYSGTMTRSALPRVDAELAQDARNATMAALGRIRTRVALTSGGLEPVVDGGAGASSLFTRSLVEVLDAARDPIEARRVHAELSARFMFRARQLNIQQHPDYAPIQFAGHEAGDFLFVPRP
jgi:hypothetical protein